MVNCLQQIVIFDEKMYHSPIGIRKVMNAINAKHKQTQPLPGVLSSRVAKLVETSNRSTFLKDVVVLFCEEVLHAPGGDFASILDWCGTLRWLSTEQNQAK